jgi:hypothetical protein
MSDNGSAYVSHLYAKTLRALGLRHLRIQPGRPQTNGCESGGGSVWGCCQARAVAACA